MKDLGDLHYFLGVQVVWIPTLVVLPQEKYVRDLLTHFTLHNAKLVHTPITSKTSFSLLDGDLLTDPTEYRSKGCAL